MISNINIRYPADIRDKSKRDNKPMFAFGYSGKSIGGTLEMHNTMDTERLETLAYFVINMNRGADPQDALDLAISRSFAEKGQLK